MLILRKVQSLYFTLVDQYYKYNIDSVYSRSWAMFLFTLASVIYSSFTACYDNRDESLLEFDTFEYLGRNDWLDRQAIFAEQATAGIVGSLGFGNIFIFLYAFAYRFLKLDNKFDSCVISATRHLKNDLIAGLECGKSDNGSIPALDLTTLGGSYSGLVDSSVYLIDRIYDIGRDSNSDLFTVNSLLDINNTNIGQAGVIDSIAPASAELRGILELYHLVMYILYLVSFTLIILATAALNQYTAKAARIANNNYTNGYELYRSIHAALVVSQLTPAEDPYNDEEVFRVFEDNVNAVSENVSVFKRNIVAAEGTVYWVYHSYIEFV